MENPDVLDVMMCDETDDLDLLLPDLDLDLVADDDPDVLRAALEFIEACEASDASSDDADSIPASPTPSSATSTTPTPAIEAKSETKPRRVTRNRRKEEIAELRVLVTELEQQLAGRKRKLHIPETLPFALATDRLPGSPPPDINVVWEHISKRQQQQRQLAELENAKLRNMVMDQLKIARDLTRVAKRRALMEGRELLDEDLPSLPPMEAKESPLMVRIYPSRPTMPTRVGMAMPLNDSEASASVNKDMFMDGTPVGAAWKSSAVAVEQTQATRVAWQSALRQFLKRRRAACCHERVEDILETAMSPKKETMEHKSLDLLYTNRYEEGHAMDSVAPTIGMWKPNIAWQSPSALLSSLLSANASVNLRLFRMEKPTARDPLDQLNEITTQFDSLSLRKSTPLPCASPHALQKWQRVSAHASSCF